jgi:hypothetical protein
VSGFQADTDQITDAAGQMGAVAGALNLSYGGVDPSGLGFPTAQAALAQFVAAWTDAGSIMNEAVSGVQKGLLNAAGNYSSAETTNTAHYTPAYH